MKQDTVKKILESVQSGATSVEEALSELKQEPFEDLGFAKVDHHRSLLQGVSEVIYGAGKTPEQIVEITKSLLRAGNQSVLITRMNPAAAELMETFDDFVYDPISQVGTVGKLPVPESDNYVLVASGGTSDQPVAEEAALTLEALGNKVIRLYDVGVAGLHRLLSHKKEIMNARCIIAVAGMEGALASVIGGLSDCPVIAVPTSVGYGASFGGVSALLSMLNSCASGVSVVNIDNGFGAGYIASMINHI